MAAFSLPVPALLLATLCCGCSTQLSTSTPDWDQHFGSRARATLALQVAYPAAASSDTAAGMDGRKARAAYERYQKAGADAALPVSGQSANNK
ncbi:hypothetical protein [Pseudoduganella danionis]|uniref:hypothetical protein n=1 Tax=Pseudoduganella danionis TaxID=1890295 RepID=UPI0035B4639A